MWANIPRLIAGVVLTVLAMSVGVSAATVRVDLTDSYGNALTELGMIRVVLSGKQPNIVTGHEVVFTDVPFGYHELTIRNKNGAFHCRMLLIEQEEIRLSYQLTWGEFLDSYRWSEAQSVPVSNASFEEPLIDVTPPGWRSGFSWYDNKSFGGRQNYLYVTDEMAYDGQYSLKLVGSWPTSSNKTAISQPVPVVPGSMYTASGMVYTDDDATGTTIALVFYDKDRNRIDFYGTQRISGQTGEWERVVTQTEVAPENAAEVSVYIQSYTTYTGTAFWDDVKLEAIHQVQ